MPTFKFQAVTPEGQFAKGQESAESMRQLVGILEQKHLYLVSWKEQNEVSENPADKYRRWELIAYMPFLSRMRVPSYIVCRNLFFAAIVLLSLVGGYLFSSRELLPKNDPRPALQKFSGVRAGMTRGAAEKHFLRSTGILQGTKTWYLENGVWIGVTYETTPGVQSSLHRIQGDPEIILPAELEFRKKK